MISVGSMRQSDKHPVCGTNPPASTTVSAARGGARTVRRASRSRSSATSASATAAEPPRTIGQPTGLGRDEGERLVVGVRHLDARGMVMSMAPQRRSPFRRLGR